MKRTMKRLAAVLLLITVMATMMTACSGNSEDHEKSDLKKIEKQGIQMENYLTLSTKGYDGSAKLYAEIDLERLYADASQFLIEDVNELPFVRPRCETVEDYLNDAFRHLDTYDLVDCETVENLSNGDKLDIYVELPDGLEHMVTIEASSSIVNYTVKDLEKFEGVNPFECAKIITDDFGIIDGEIGFKLTGYVDLPIQKPDGSSVYVRGTADVEEDRVYKRTDTVHITLNPEYIEEYGKNFFTCTETNMTLEKTRYLPVGDHATDIFTCMGTKCMSNVIFATQEMMNDYTDTETTVENVGMMFFHDGEDVLDSRDYGKFYNQLIFVNKITNEYCPQGWYTYVGVSGGVGIGYELNYDTFELEKCVGYAYFGCLGKNYRDYFNEAINWNDIVYTNSFECNGVEYPGHRDLSDVFVALNANFKGLEEYDHLIVTESLKDYVQEY